MALSSITDTRQYLTFALGQEVFALDVSHAREILEYSTVTKVPQTPDFMKGIINLRGSVVPVVDMRLKLGLVETEKTVDTCIIIVETDFDGEGAIIGALVDSVREVFELESQHIEAPPKMGTSLKMEFIKGIGKQDENFIIILDTDKVFSAEELALICGQERDDQIMRTATG
ncbi:MAG TPA: chemotaxis protein CheW [Syntrophorhabdaceae bacterium]|nr:chemotaxis protein CheW [Syntrophorhabdaceae bacterium]